MNSKKIVWQETGIAAAGVLLCTALMIGIFALAGKFDISVLLGGAAGAPVEGIKKVIDVEDFTEIFNPDLPNDDLDLQLVWLNAVSYGFTACINLVIRIDDGTDIRICGSRMCGYNTYVTAHNFYVRKLTLHWSVWI